LRLGFKEKYGPYAIIAGGSDGLGYAFAESLARRGINLILFARQKERLELAAIRLRNEYNIDAISIAADMFDYDNIKNIVSSLNVKIGLLIYNAAFAPIRLFEDLSEEELIKINNINVKTPLLLTKLISERMIKDKRGGIILMSSLAGTQGSPKISTYAATKAFNTILAEGLWWELKKHNIDVLASCAGAISTPGYNNAKKKKAPGTLTPYQVAEKTIKALGKKPVIVPGLTNKIGRFMLMRLFSRKNAIKLMSKNTGDLS